MVVSCLKDVSTMLTIVSAVRTRNITQHFQAERQMLRLIFTFDHINYVRYNSFQHVFLSNHSKGNPQAFDDLLKYRFGATSLGETFSTIHEDLVAENFNKESKGKTGPYRSGYISHQNKVNKWIVTFHINSKLRMIQREKWRLHTSSKHKEITISDKRMHHKHDENLKSQLKDYNVDPFEVS